MKPKALPKLILRTGAWTLKRNVPVRYHAVENRRQIWRTLSAANHLKAQKEAEAFWKQCLVSWERKLIATGHIKSQENRLASLQVHNAGFAYLPISKVAILPIEDLLARIEKIAQNSAGELDLCMADALLGLLPEPRLISDIFSAYRSYAFKIETISDAPQRIRQRQVGDMRAVNKLIQFFGDVDITSLKLHEVGQMYREVWMNERIPPSRLSTLNDRLYRLQRISSAASMVLGFDMPFRFSDAAMKERWRPERPAFSEQWIKDRIIGSGALMRLPEAERLLILGMINTGYRLMEGANLLPAEIVLDHDIPHLNLSGTLHPLKTPAAYRLIPLTGISLEAFRAAPKGFASLRDDPALSARLNRFLTKEGLRETGRHTVHSFRHSFAARLAQAGVYEGMIAQLMGHKLRRGYGRGAPLILRIKAIQSLGF